MEHLLMVECTLGSMRTPLPTRTRNSRHRLNLLTTDLGHYPRPGAANPHPVTDDHHHSRTVDDENWCRANDLLTPPAISPTMLTSSAETEAGGWARSSAVRDHASVTNQGARVREVQK